MRLKSPDTALTCHKLFFMMRHVNISLYSLDLFHSHLLNLPPSCACRRACSGLRELLGDYYLLEAGEVMWAQAGVAWQTEVAGVSLPSLKD